MKGVREDHPNPKVKMVMDNVYFVNFKPHGMPPDVYIDHLWDTVIDAMDILESYTGERPK